MLFPRYGIGALTSSQSQIAQQIVATANQYGVPPNLALGIASHESGFNPSATNLNHNGTTDWGVMQLNDTTVQTLGVSNPLDPTQNIKAGVGLLAKYLQQYNGDQTKALIAYAAGPGAVPSGGTSATASFVNYVTSYAPDPSLDLSIPDSGDGSTPDSGDVQLAGMTISTPELAFGAAVILTALYLAFRA